MCDSEGCNRPGVWVPVVVFMANNQKTRAVVGELAFCIGCRTKILYPADILETGGNEIAQEIYEGTGGFVPIRTLEWAHMLSKEVRDWKKEMERQAPASE
jgi:hypothetical protein